MASIYHRVAKYSNPKKRGKLCLNWSPSQIWTKECPKKLNKICHGFLGSGIERIANRLNVCRCQVYLKVGVLEYFAVTRYVCRSFSRIAPSTPNSVLAVGSCMTWKHSNLELSITHRNWLAFKRCEGLFYIKAKWYVIPKMLLQTSIFQIWTSTTRHNCLSFVFFLYIGL